MTPRDGTRLGGLAQWMLAAVLAMAGGGLILLQTAQDPDPTPARSASAPSRAETPAAGSVTLVAAGSQAADTAGTIVDPEPPASAANRFVQQVIDAVRHRGVQERLESMIDRPGDRLEAGSRHCRVRRNRDGRQPLGTKCF